MHNLKRAFNALSDRLNLKTGADGRERTLYSFRHFYAALNLELGVTTGRIIKLMAQKNINNFDEIHTLP